MRQDHQQQIGIVQRQTLTQSARQLVQLVVAPPAEFADLVARGAADNPFLTVSRSVPRGAEARPDIPAQRPGLYAHVLAELPLLVRRKADLPIALRLAEGLDERGFWPTPCPGSPPN
jgi:DNA-directed RNA polymerase specialized sigma54-like protein